MDKWQTLHEQTTIEFPLQFFSTVRIRPNIFCSDTNDLNERTGSNESFRKHVTSCSSADESFGIQPPAIFRRFVLLVLRGGSCSTSALDSHCILGHQFRIIDVAVSHYTIAIDGDSSTNSDDHVIPGRCRHHYNCFDSDGRRLGGTKGKLQHGPCRHKCQQCFTVWCSLVCHCCRR